MEKSGSSNIDFEKLREIAGNCKRVLLKLPDGLYSLSTEISDFLSSIGVESIISANSCYGACDFCDGIEGMEVDRIIYVGEAEMPYLRKKYPVRTSFLEIESKFDAAGTVEKALPLLEGKRIGVVSITPYIHQMGKCIKILEGNNFIPVVGKKSRRTSYDGQILGCDLTAGTSISGKVDSFLYVGDGLFHPLGLSLSTKKPVVVADPSQNMAMKDEIREMRQKFMKIRYAMISNSMGKNRMGIIIGEKLGQKRVELAYEMKKLAEEKGMEAYIISSNNLSPDRIDYMALDFYVSTSCPRIAIDDYSNYKKPLLTPIEFEILTGEREWENYEFDQIL
ncbi:MAG: diphthamide biosynthesis enzyme Dph2 [Thermoplasmata archaeon]|jgi:2-(3-amino-3-carboxypropyl)histidine synthase|nr:MAG: diphthamide biosynthesis enzyme Dph2 [Thermoplasmata archaeon]RLF64596.1 MAG: diphthamide biosynthesis enzyme Dph2 [Thermoplasmata archaeon]